MQLQLCYPQSFHVDIFYRQARYTKILILGYRLSRIVGNLSLKIRSPVEKKIPLTPLHTHTHRYTHGMIKFFSMHFIVHLFIFPSLSFFLFFFNFIRTEIWSIFAHFFPYLSRSFLVSLLVCCDPPGRKIFYDTMFFFFPNDTSIISISERC